MNIWVFAQESNGAPTSATLELVAKARTLGTVTAFVGGDASAIAGALPGPAVSAAMKAVIDGGDSPDLIMFPQNYEGRDVMSRLSVKLDRTVLTNNVDVAAEGATIDLVHWWQVPSLSRAHAAEEVDATVAEIRAGVIEHGRRRAEESIALRDDARVTIAWHLREGDPQDGIQDWATGHDNDLIVVGSHGRRGLRRLILGSTAEATVRHATCSVLVARARPDDDAATPPHDTPS